MAVVGSARFLPIYLRVSLAMMHPRGVAAVYRAIVRPLHYGLIMAVEWVRELLDSKMMSEAISVQLHQSSSLPH